MKNVKTTIYLPEDLRRAVKKHLIDTGETLSAYTEGALRAAMKADASRDGKRKRRAVRTERELDAVIKELERS